MKSIKTFVEKLRPPTEAVPSDAATTTAKGSTGQQPKQKQPPLPSVIKMPDELMEQLFPERPLMVSAVFGEPSPAGSPELPADAAVPPELPQSKPQPQRKMKTTGELSISDELMETIFPKQKVMVSVLFKENDPKPLAPEPVPRQRPANDSSTERDFPIV